jgi:hypothetical protein
MFRFSLLKGLQECLYVLELLWVQNKSHRRHGGHPEIFKTFCQHGIGFEQALLDVGSGLAGANTVQSWADGAALTSQGMAEHAGGCGVLVEDLLATLWVSSRR